jgi:hypothetical protein
MLSRSTSFDTIANGQLRPLSWSTRFSFDKSFDPTLDFFILDQSVLNGDDILAPSDNNVIQEWDKYAYSDYSNRIISMEWQREEDFPYSVSMAMADVTFNNTDDYFTPNGGSPIDSYIIPKRPLRLLSGFNGELLPSFVGLTEKMPVIEESSKQASFHATDFLAFLFNKPLNQTVIYEDLRTDEVIEELLQLAGLTTGQYILETGFNKIPFIWFPIGTTYGDAFRKIMQAEMGSLYMDEMGIIRFVNKNSRSTTPVYYFDKSNTHDIKVSSDDEIINVVQIKANVREVQTIQPIFNLDDDGTSQEQLVPAGGSVELFYSFENPVTTVADIDFYTANSNQDGTGIDLTSDISITDVDIFDVAIKVTWTNTSTTNAFITGLTIFGTPAPVVRTIDYRDQDNTSVDKYEEKILTIENDFIQTQSAAERMASILLYYYSEYGGVVEIKVKGNPALQIGDCITVNDGNTSDNYIISKITNSLQAASFSQSLTAKIQRARTFFILDQSVLDGTDVLSP